MEIQIETRLLRYVIAAADEGNITRAAKTRLYIAGPSLAREIRELEARLGYALFERHWRGVSLTPAGFVFVDEARKSLAHMKRAAERGFAASRGEGGALSIGYTPLLEASRLCELRQRLARAIPYISLQFHSAFSFSQFELVLSEVLQAGLVFLPVEVDDIQSQRVWRDKLVVAVPEGSPLAVSPILGLRELSEEPSVWLRQSLKPSFHSQILASFQQAGYLPNIVHEVSTCDELLDAVGAGVGLGFIKESTSRRVRVKGVVFRDVEDPGLQVEIGVIYRSDNSSQRLKTLLQVLNDLSHADESTSELTSG